jgi:basic membrane lipoprotein Med (substrate-binding protein (PBP1-ABC) superfamily)
VIIGCTEIKQELAAYEKTKLALEGKLPFGSADVVGVKDGFVGFAFDDELFVQFVPEEVRKAQKAIYDEMASGRLSMPMPVF